jgi:hypothetical protein
MARPDKGTSRRARCRCGSRWLTGISSRSVVIGPSVGKREGLAFQALSGDRITEQLEGDRILIYRAHAGSVKTSV